jgi:peptidoglycan/LPS O-acetylase OafA/YrhL
MRYQPHVDGLRTLAVVPVVLFHLNHAYMPGGYAGVDIFFVISGYLITSILWRDMLVGEYSLLEFYKRRILRILPALSVVLLAVVLLASAVQLTHERMASGQSAMAAALFVSNIFFWQDAGYFSAPAEMQPLLHTWSLAVEEQFYIFFPPLLYILARHFRHRVMALIAGLSLVSLVLCVVMTLRHQPAAFYLLPFRAWELGIGALLALAVARGQMPGAARSWPGLVGLALILAAFVLFDHTSAFPGWLALFPCLGAALLIGLGDRGVTGRLLAAAPMVWIGKVSYSFYLWHWPVIVFWKLQTGPEITLSEASGLFVVALGLASVSTRWIEAPFRAKGFHAIAPARVILSGVGVLVVLTAIGLLLARDVLALRPVPSAVASLAQVADYRAHPDYDGQYRKGTCMIGQSEARFEAYDKAICAITDPDLPTVLLIGDSHAAQYWRALQDAFPGINVIQATASGCRPLREAPGARFCTDLRSWFFDNWLDATRPAAILLAARWQEDELNRVQPTLDWLSSKTDRLAVIGPIVEYEGALPQLLARARWQEKGFDSAVHRTPGKAALDAQMRHQTEAAGAIYLSVLDRLCPPEDAGDCQVLAADDTPIQFDYGHLTLTGARTLVLQMRAELAPVMTGITVKADISTEADQH